MNKFSFTPLVISLIASVFILIVSIGISLKTIGDSYIYFGWVDHTYLVLQKLEEAEHELVKVESNAMAYARFKDIKYSVEFEKDTANLRKYMDEIYYLAKDNKLQLSNIVAWEIKVNKRIDTATNGLSPSFNQKVFQQKDNTYKRLVLQNETDMASAKIEKMERGLLTKRKKLAYDNLANSKITIIISGIILFVSSFIIFILFSYRSTF